MRQTAIMDFLADWRGPDGTWAPTSERVLHTAELGSDTGAAAPAVAAATASLAQFLAGPADPDSLPSVPSFDQFSARPGRFGSIRPEEPASAGPYPLTTEDFDALEDLTYAELAQARGVDPAAIERLSGVKLERPPGRPAPAPPLPTPTPPPPRPAVRPVAAAPPPPPPPAAPAAPVLPTWPPEGHAGAPVRARQQWPRRRRAPLRPFRVIAAVALLGAVAAAAWYFLLRPSGPSTPSGWDGRVASTVAFVAHEERLPWKHPVRVVFLSRAGFQQRFGELLASAQSRPGPVGTDVADYEASGQVVYVSGDSLDYYGRYALAGQLTEALRAQYPGSASAAMTRAQALRIQTVYLSELSPAQLRALRAEQAAHT